MAIGDVPRKIVIDGRIQFGKQFIKEASNQLGILKHNMSYRELRVGERRVKFNDNVHFICNVNHHQETIQIITDPWLPIEKVTPYLVCPKTNDMAYGYIDSLAGMEFNKDGNPYVYPSQFYTSRSPTWNIWVCEGIGDGETGEDATGRFKYSFWTTCKPFCFFVFDHKDDADWGWIYDCRQSLTEARKNPKFEDVNGHPILARPVRNENGIIFDYRVMNIIPENFQKWQTFQKSVTSRALRY